MKNSDLLLDLFQAYYDARKNKRSTINALEFELDYEKNLLQLHEDLLSEKYTISKSICFISFYPVRREIFAGNFRDRVIHHLVFNYLNPLFERLFINDSYSCRKNRGTSHGIKRLDHFIRSCSQNYSQDCYILKLDISGYFMSIDRVILYQKIQDVLNRFRGEAIFDVDFILRLIHKIIFHDSTKNCVIKGNRDDWQGLPKSKSLFFSAKNKGLPIGNLTSQLFGNIYLNDFDHYITHKLVCKNYGRYVDDFFIIHRDPNYLKSLTVKIRTYLKKEVSLELHPKKIYLQHYSKGVDFLGVWIKPYRIYIRNNTKGQFYKTLIIWNNIIQKQNGNLSKDQLKKFLASINSYLGIMQHYKTYKLRRKMLEQNIAKYFWNYVCVSDYHKKIVVLQPPRVEFANVTP